VYKFDFYLCVARETLKVFFSLPARAQKMPPQTRPSAKVLFETHQGSDDEEGSE
jgi:hypothetical protein